GSTATKPGYPRRLEIHGERGTIILRDDDIAVWDVEGVDPAKYLSREKKNLGDTFTKPGYADPTNHRAQLRDFVDAIREGRRPKVDGREGRRALEVLRAIYQSSNDGKVVKFPVQE
ncbi:MAG TPA: Gfo/Idh/MocA family oxidoreductase, partial [Chloroflexota bacterium]|nr:Gfo/Idh/MocA family oxidoreductase [Chloroflexota bacterium]